MYNQLAFTFLLTCRAQDDARPKLVLTASCGLEPGRVVEYKPLLDSAIGIATHKPTSVIVKQRAQCVASLQGGRDEDWDKVMLKAVPADCVPVSATDPLYILCKWKALRATRAHLGQTRRAQLVDQKVWCEKMVDTQWHCGGR